MLNEGANIRRSETVVQIPYCEQVFRANGAFANVALDLLELREKLLADLLVSLVTTTRNARCVGAGQATALHGVVVSEDSSA